MSRTCEAEKTTITTQALHWAPGRRSNMGRLRTRRRNTVGSEMKAMQLSWGSLTRLAEEGKSGETILLP